MQDEKNPENIDSGTEYIDEDSSYEPYKNSHLSEGYAAHDQTTMFFNKYSENTDIPSAANILADAIIEYEISQ